MADTVLNAKITKESAVLWTRGTGQRKRNKSVTQFQSSEQVRRKGTAGQSQHWLTCIAWFLCAAFRTELLRVVTGFVLAAFLIVSVENSILPQLWTLKHRQVKVRHSQSHSQGVGEPEFKTGQELMPEFLARALCCLSILCRRYSAKGRRALYVVWLLRVFYRVL